MVLLSNSTVSSQAAASATVTMDECSDLIVAVYLRRNIKLSDGMVAYSCGQELLLPLRDMMLLLEFPITVTPNGATGWLLREDNTFVLNLATYTVTVAGVSHSVESTTVRLLDGELFVATAALASWMPLEFIVDLPNMTLYVTPKQPLPMEERRERAGRQVSTTEVKRTHLPRVATPYSSVQIPAIHTDLSVGYAKHKSAVNNGLVTNSTVRAFGDLGYMNNHTWITTNDARITQGYLRWGRIDPECNLLGPFAATTWEIGDVTSTSIPLVATTLSGRGAHISSRAASFVAEFDRITLEDTLPPGYEVELYRNDTLIAALRTSDNGKYRFSDVLLQRGRNELRLEFYGPQGQRNTEHKSYYVDNNRIPTGAFNYDISITDLNRSVFGINDYLGSNYAANAIGGSAQIDYGLSPDITLTWGLLAMPLRRYLNTTIAHRNESYRYYSNLGLRTQLWGMGLALDSAFDDIGGKALGFNAKSQLAEWDLNLSYTHYLDNFVSGASAGSFGIGEQLQAQTSARIQRNFYAPATRLSFNLGLRGNYAQYVNNNNIWSVSNNIGVFYGITSFNNDITYQQNAVTNRIYSDTSINMRLLDNMSLRASASYDLGNRFIFNQYSLGFNAALSNSLNLNLSYYRNPANPTIAGSYSTDGYAAAVTHDFSTLQLGLQLSYRSTDSPTPTASDGWTIAATAAFDLFPDPHSGLTKMSSKSLAAQGAIHSRAFMDANANGVRDPAEPLLDGVGVISSAYANTPYVTSSKRDEYPQYSVPVDNWIDVQLDPTRMPDPVAFPGGPGVAVLPRPGVVSQVELAVVTAADIAGTVTLNGTGGLHPLANVRVQVVRQEQTGQETVMGETYTEYDGLYTLTNVPIGTYTVRIFPDQVKLLNAKPATRNIVLQRDTGLLENVNIELIQ